MSPFHAIAARWLPLARKAAGLADVPVSAFGRAWDRATPQHRRFLARIALVPHPEDVAALQWLKIAPALRLVIAARARELHDWLGAFDAEPEAAEAGQ